MAYFRIAFIASLLAACSSRNAPSDQHPGSAGASGSPSASDAPANNTPGVVASTLCVISADCPAGAHCDLGECIQDCNRGQRVCERRHVLGARALPRSERPRPGRDA